MTPEFISFVEDCVSDARIYGSIGASRVLVIIHGVLASQRREILLTLALTKGFIPELCVDNEQDVFIINPIENLSLSLRFDAEYHVFDVSDVEKLM